MNAFTPRAQHILALARKEADRLHMNYVGTEHVLLGLIRLNQGTAVEVMQKRGLDLEAVRLEVEKQVGSGSNVPVLGNIPFTPRVKRVLAVAGKLARSLDQKCVGTGPILLGILSESGGLAARVVGSMGLEFEAARKIIIEMSKETAADLLEAPTSMKTLPSSVAGIPLAASAAAGNFLRLEEDFRRTREDIFNKFESILAAIQAMREDISQLRIDVMKGNS